MPTHIAVIVSKPSKHREQHRKHDDDNKQLSGWAPEREPKDEPRAANLNLHLGKWLDRAAANSGPRVAPGTGTKKSS